jgi:hypothetical protein
VTATPAGLQRYCGVAGATGIQHKSFITQQFSIRSVRSWKVLLWNSALIQNAVGGYRIDWTDDPALPMLAPVQYPNDSRGAAGMKATKTELIRLARLIQKDIASGRVSKSTQRALEMLADYQNSAIALLELALQEAGKEQSDKPLVDSLGFLFSHVLETLRFDIESGYKTASDLAESVRKRLVTASETGAFDPSTLLFLARCFGTAKLDLGEELRGVVEHLLEAVGEAHADDFDPADTADLFGLVAGLVKQADGDPFALHAVLAESSEGVPDEHRAVMAAALLFSGEAAAVEVSIGWLLDSATSVRRRSRRARARPSSSAARCRQSAPGIPA